MPTNNRAVKLAAAYCRTILGRGINFHADRWLLKQASQLCKAIDELDASDDDAITLLNQLHNGESDLIGYKRWNEWAEQRALDIPVSMLHLLYVKPNGRADVNLLQAALEIREIPSVQDAASYADWVRQYGPRAYRTGKWDGVYRYQPFVAPERQAIPPDELRQILGDELAERSLAELAQLERSLGDAILQSPSREGTGGGDSTGPYHQYCRDADPCG